MIGVSLRPQDPFAKKVPSTGIQTRNVLIKVTVPKWTGRKRKRGSNEPFTSPSPPETPNSNITAPDLVRRLRDNEGQYSITPVGLISETHRFRSQPDFQLRAADMPITEELRKHLGSPTYHTLKDFNMNLAPKASGNFSFPLAPSLTYWEQPIKYDYRQAPDIVYLFDEEGQPVSVNPRTLPKRQTESVAPDAKAVPNGPSPAVMARYNNDERMLRIAEEFGKLMEQRPLLSARVALNVLRARVPGLRINPTVIKDVLPRTGYLFAAGPWRDVVVKYGIDPRPDPKMRFYQSIMFQLDQGPAVFREKGDAADQDPSDSDMQNGHIFDGTTYPKDGKMWLLCDLTDPVLYQILHEATPAEECDLHQWGWFRPATIIKVRVIMKDKLMLLKNGIKPNDEDYQPLADLPEDLEELGYGSRQRYIDIGYSERAADVLMEYRKSLKTMSNQRKAMVSLGQRPAVKGKESVRVKGKGKSRMGDGDANGGAEAEDVEVDVDGDGEEEPEAMETT
jgi:general transcription factor 3C polypeptide 5 (transcription factor C subunit 1)